MSNETAGQEELEGARVALQLAARLVHEEFDNEQVSLFCAPGFFDASPFGGDDESVREGLRLMRRWCSAHADADDFDDACDALRRDWLSLIAGVGEPKAPSWAGYYANTNSQVLSAETLPVRRMYREHGFAAACPESCPDDDLGIMLQFLSELVGERALGGQLAQRALPDERKLLANHILPWISTWRWNMATYAKTDFYRGVGEFAFGVIRAYAKAVGFTYVDDLKAPCFVDASDR